MLIVTLLEGVLYLLFNHNSNLLSVVSVYKTDAQKGEWLGS